MNAAERYWDINGTAVGAGGASPSGSWAAGNWGNATGTGATGSWIAGDTAVFSAGTDATGPFSVTLDTPITLVGITRVQGTPSILGSGGGVLTFLDGQFAVNSGDGLLIASVLYEPVNGTINKTGSGVFSSEAVQTSFDGKWVVQEGVLSVPGESALGILPVSAKEQVVLDGGRFSISTQEAEFHVRRRMYLGEAGGGFDQAGTIRWNGVIGGLGSLTQYGSGMTVLGGENTYAGATVVAAGTLRLGGQDVIPDGSPVTVMSGATLDINNQMETIKSLAAPGGIVNLGSGTLFISAPGGETCSAAISGTGGRIHKKTSGAWTLNGDSGPGWGITLSDGTLYAGGDTSLGTETFVFFRGRLAAKGSAARVWSMPMTIKSDVTLGDPVNNGAMTFNGGAWTIDALSGMRKFLTVDTATVTINAVIGQSALDVGLHKAGNGTLILGANNTFSGGVTVAEGTLVANNTEGSATGAGEVWIQQSGTLSGTGKISGLTRVEGTLAPGNPTGTLTFGQFPELSGNLRMVLNRDATPNASKLVILTEGTLYHTVSSFEIQKIGSDFTGGEVFDLVDVAGNGNGAIALVLPTLPAVGAGLNWYTGRFAQDGTIAVNRRPVVGLPLSVTTQKDTPVNVSLAKARAGAVDADGDVLTVENPRNALPSGAAVTLGPTSITYTPLSGASGSGSFIYTLKDGRGGLIDVTATVNIVTGSGVSPNIVYGPVKEGGAFVVRFAGIPGMTYTVEASDGPTGPWVKWEDNKTAPVDNSLGFGIGVFEIREPTSATSRYFRTVSPAY